MLHISQHDLSVCEDEIKSLNEGQQKQFIFGDTQGNHRSQIMEDSRATDRDKIADKWKTGLPSSMVSVL